MNHQREMQEEEREEREERLARGLGWFSCGLGITELLAPQAVSRLVGVDASPGLIRLLGARELASGIGLLTQQRPAGWMWSRVGGDLMDLALLTTAFSREQRNRGRVAAAVTAVAGVTALDWLCAQELSRGPGAGNGATHVRSSLIINRPPEELYEQCRDFEQMPRLMPNLKSVQKTGENRWHWVAQGPVGSSVEWDGEVINDHPNELIAWRTLPGATVPHAGTVRFERAPGGRGTILKVELQYRPPLGAAGAALAKMFGQAPEKQVPADLLRFKQWMETGEIARTEGQSAGRKRSTSRKYDELVRA